MLHQRIFLIGFMGAGKTTLGKKIAHRSGLPFLDIDQEIENHFQLSINAIFEKYGEPFFRKEESKMLIQIINKYPKAIISVGGGLPCFNKNMELMNNAGITCYLQRPAKELFHRLEKDTKNRPLLLNKSKEELLQFIQDKLSEREVFYNKSKIIAQRDQQEIDTLMKLLNLKPLT